VIGLAFVPILFFILMGVFICFFRKASGKSFWCCDSNRNPKVIIYRDNLECGGNLDNDAEVVMAAGVDIKTDIEVPLVEPEVKVEIEMSKFEAEVD